MKRPLMIVCLCIVVAMALCLKWKTKPDTEEEVGILLESFIYDKEILTVTGQVFKIQTKVSYGQEQYLLYLHVNHICKTDIGSTELFMDHPINFICEVKDKERPFIGSQLKIQGQFTYFTNATNDGEFDAAQYYQILGIAGSLKNAKLLDTGKEYSFLLEGLYQIKNYWRQQLYQKFPQKEASILYTMLLGGKEELDQEIKKLYQRNGIVHILSISGLHITMLGMGLYGLLRKIGCHKMAAALLGGAVLILYGIMTGMGISAVRAIGMYLIRMLAECVGRTYDMMTSLGIMAIVLLAGQPKYLQHSGFLLSFGSICGIGIVLPTLDYTGKQKGTVKGKRLWEHMKQSLLAGLSITLFTLPIQLYYYYEIPIYALILNLLVLPLMTIVMAAGLIVMLLPGMRFLSLLVQWILSFYEILCHSFDNLPFHTWNPGCPKPWQILVYYSLLIALIVIGMWNKKQMKEGNNKRKRTQKGERQEEKSNHQVIFGWNMLKGFLVIASLFIIGIKPGSGLQITFLDVGQGDCIFLRTDSGENYLFDSGSSDKSQIGNYILIPFLKYNGIQHLDGVFLSHPDKDHYSGILELLEQSKESGISIERLILPAIEQGLRTEEMKVLLAAAKENLTPPAISYIARGSSWTCGSTEFTCLHPPSGMMAQETNAYSECFYITYQGFSLLLTGDVQGEGEASMLQELETICEAPLTVLKVAHHGSRNSTPQELLTCLEPRLAVISCGENNSYGHPHKELLERLQLAKSQILQTPVTGAITLYVKNGEVKVGTFRKQ